MFVRFLTFFSLLSAVLCGAPAFADEHDHQGSRIIVLTPEEAARMAAREQYARDAVLGDIEAQVRGARTLSVLSGVSMASGVGVMAAAFAVADPNDDTQTEALVGVLCGGAVLFGAGMWGLIRQGRRLSHLKRERDLLKAQQPTKTWSIGPGGASFNMTF